MKLLVIGNSVVDTIDFNGEIKTKPGGIFYTVTALNNFKDNQDKISLVTALDEKHYLLFKDEYEKLDGKVFNYVESIPKVWLKVEKYSERHEKYENINQNLSFNIKDFSKYDGILINMITGFDITLEQLKDIRENYEEAIINEVLDYGVKYLIVTLEEKGAKVFFKENNVLKNFHESAITVNIKNKVGCGDVFGAVFFYCYISQGYKSINKALQLANLAAGYTASYAEISEFINLKKDVFSRYNKIETIK